MTAFVHILCATLVFAVSVNSQCSDRDERCVHWKKSGFCARPDVTTQQKARYCAKSCDLCGVNAIGLRTATDCVDTLEQCPEWVALGYCNGPFHLDTKKLCAKSCNLCSSA